MAPLPSPVRRDASRNGRPRRSVLGRAVATRAGAAGLLALLLGLYVLLLGLHGRRLRQELGAVAGAALLLLPGPEEVLRFRGAQPALRYDALRRRPVFGPAFPFPEDTLVARNWTFPRWDGAGIAFRSLQMFVEAMPANATTLPWPKLFRQFPELLYVLDADGLAVSAARRRTISKANQRYRVYPTEEAMRLAHRTLQERRHRHRWTRLRRALAEGGFPFLVWNGDFKSCNLHNYRGHSIPLFTVCGALSCNHSFPLPNYKTILDSKPESADWDATFAQHRHNYSADRKIPQVVWRGSLTGSLSNFTSDRARIGRFPLDHPSPLLDVGLSSIPERHQRHNATALAAYFGGLARPIKPMERFQRYAGILDIDGNSWSSRFGALLCYNAVVLKVEPRYVDHFYRSLTPWVQTIPVKRDLSDLLRKAAFAVDPANRDTVAAIVRNANDWCRRHMLYGAVARDMLDVWEAYLHHLDRGDPAWPDLWRQWKPALLATAGGLDMRPLVDRFRVLKATPATTTRRTGRTT